MALYDSLDLKWTWDGDLEIGKDGDISDNSDDYLTSLETEIRTIIKSELGDWAQHPMLGANLSDFRGEPNTRETANAIQERIVSSLITQGIVQEKDLNVRIIPVHIYQVMVVISVNAVPTSENRLSPGESLIITFTYDTLEDSVFFVPTGDESNYGF